MPYNLQPASVASGAVMPQALCLSFTEINQYPMLSSLYNDGTFQCSLIQDGVNAPRSLRTFTLAQRLTTAQLTTLLQFWEQTTVGGLNPFYFYNPFDVCPVGSNWDATGGNQQGRITCFFRGDWSQRSELGRHVVPGLTIVEVA
jgi:hypothetical protein